MPDDAFGDDAHGDKLSSKPFSVNAENQFSAECKPPVPARKAMFMRLQRIGNEAAANDNLAVLIKFQVGLEKHDTID
jgi:hypothetical protein